MHHKNLSLLPPFLLIVSCLLLVSCASKTACQQYADDYEKFADRIIEITDRAKANPEDVAKNMEEMLSVMNETNLEKFSDKELKAHREQCASDTAATGKINRVTARLEAVGKP